MQTIQWPGVARGAVAGLLVIAPLTALRAVLDHNVADFDSSGWVPLFAVGLFFAYAFGGWVAGRHAPDAPLSNGLLAGIGTLAAWLVVRVVIWAARESDKTLLGGDGAVLTAGNLLGAIVFAAVFGLAGALVGARMVGGGESAGRPRAGIHPSEERPDSTGQGAG